VLVIPVIVDPAESKNTSFPDVNRDIEPHKDPAEFWIVIRRVVAAGFAVM